MTLLWPAVRKFTLTAHIVSSVGWLGAVGVFLALAVAAVTSDDQALVRGAYLAMDAAAWFVLVPLAVGSLLTGVAQSLGTHWGLLRHYWVLAKLILTVIATAVLLLYTQTLDAFADTAADSAFTTADLALLRNPTVVLHSTAALIVLLMTTVLAVNKPRGLTRYGQRRRHQLIR